MGVQVPLTQLPEREVTAERWAVFLRAQRERQRGSEGHCRRAWRLRVGIHQGHPRRCRRHRQASHEGTAPGRIDRVLHWAGEGNECCSKARVPTGLCVKPNPFPQQFAEQCTALTTVPHVFPHFLPVMRSLIFRNPLVVYQVRMFIKFAINYQRKLFQCDVESLPSY